jgi:hypothetical protein
VAPRGFACRSVRKRILVLALVPVLSPLRLYVFTPTITCGMCRLPTPVADLEADLDLPWGVLQILLADLAPGP